MENKEQKAITRRSVLKASVGAGIALAAGGLKLDEALAATGAKKSPSPEAAKTHFLKSMNCSQAILETYAPAYGVTPKLAEKLATGFAGGMGMGHECGAVTAAYMVIGLACGPQEEQVFPKLKAFSKEFKARYRGLGCSELLGVDMESAEGIKEADKKGYFTSRCPNYVRTAGELLEKIIA